MAHLSDSHVFCPNQIAWSQLLNKRIFGYLSWQFQRRSAKTDQILAAVLCDLDQQSIDHVVVTGDLTHVGLPCDFRAVRQLLKRMGPPCRVTVIPGNHDALVDTDWKESFALVSDYMVSDEWPVNQEVSCDQFPLLRIRGAIAMIGLSTAHPSLPFLAVGAVGNRQLERLSSILQQTGAQGLFRIILIHHPPIPGAVKWRKRLTDQAAFHAVVSQHGAELILHGHTHRSSLNRLEAHAGPIPVIGAPSVTIQNHWMTSQGQYHLYCLQKSSSGWAMRITARCLPPRQSRLVSKSIGEFEIRLPNRYTNK